MILTMILSAFLALNTANTTLVLDAPEGHTLKMVAYGPRLSEAEVADLEKAGLYGIRCYPAYGLINTEETAIAVTQADGSKTLDLDICGTEITSWEGGKILCVTAKDPVYPVTVKNYFKTYEAEDLIETWAEITNTAVKSRKKDGTLVLNRYDSGCLPIRLGDVWTTTFYGTWANEARICEEPLQRGQRVIKNIDGTRNSHTSHAEVMISLDGKARENDGRVIGAALCWGGNYELRFNTTDEKYHRFFAGICADNAEYYLAEGETFKTPELAYSYSENGLSGVSRNFHRWGRKYRLAHGERQRDILLNSWEGVYFDINEPGMDQMMSDISSMGGELFVMDDGWFGDKYRRLSDNSSLGDWVVDREKLPNGIGGLVQTAKKYGIKFGIWIEPEMTNSVSELYEAHPDWVIKAPGRDVVKGRGGTQLVLDLCNPEVQDFVVGTVDRLMKENPEIAYIKWDANMPFNAHGSQYLKHQSHLPVDYWRGLASVCDRIRAAWPDITIQCCASGGGRVNWGALPWFDEFWCSDNTDALQRIYMQWGTSYFFPAIAMASHISATPNHTVFRTTSLKFRCDVASAGRLGMEIQPKNMTDTEKEFCRQAISNYKMIRPVVQFGDIYRLISPYEGKGCASMMYVSPEKDKAVFYWWRIENLFDTHFPRAIFEGLDPDRRYTVRELNRIDLEPLPCEGQTFTGKFLMDNGLELRSTNECAWGDKSDWSSRLLYLESL